MVAAFHEPGTLDQHPMRFARRSGLLLLSALLAGCGDDGRAAGVEMPVPEAGGGPGEGGILDAGFQDGPPAADAAGLCGNQFFQVTPEPPNLYFVLDRSGSMLDTASPTTTTTKYSAVRKASIDVVLELGSLVNVGAAVFPGNPDASECSTGSEVFSTRRGDVPGSFTGSYGPVTAAFASAINVAPAGGTPTAATLRSLLSVLTPLPGRTSVVLATDGGPNCSAEHACGPEDCIWNIEGATLYEQPCTPEYNCCDPYLVQGPGPRACLDGAATAAAVAALRDLGIRTYVVGIPGSEYYESLLDQLATLGGGARPTSPRYYRVDDVTTLRETLAAISKKALVTCEFLLDAPPPDPDFVNVYLDRQAVPYDPVNGWSWTGDRSLRLQGESCAKLERGEVVQVQVVAGCPTQQPR